MCRFNTRSGHRSFCCPLKPIGKWGDLRSDCQAVGRLKKLLSHREQCSSLGESMGEKGGGEEGESGQNSSKRGKKGPVLLCHEGGIVCRHELNKSQCSKTTPKIVIIII